MQWPTLEEFAPALCDAIVPWREVPERVPLRLTKLENIQTQFGSRLIVSLEDQTGSTMRAWVPEGVRKQFADKKAPFFILNAGLTYFSENSERTYWEVRCLSNTRVRESKRPVPDS